MTTAEQIVLSLAEAIELSTGPDDPLLTQGHDLDKKVQVAIGAFQAHDCDQHYVRGAHYSSGPTSGWNWICEVCDDSFFGEEYHDIQHAEESCGLACKWRYPGK